MICPLILGFFFLLSHRLTCFSALFSSILNKAWSLCIQSLKQGALSCLYVSRLPGKSWRRCSTALHLSQTHGWWHGSDTDGFGLHKAHRPSRCALLFFFYGGTMNDRLTTHPWLDTPDDPGACVPCSASCILNQSKLTDVMWRYWR